MSRDVSAEEKTINGGPTPSSSAQAISCLTLFTIQDKSNRLFFEFPAVRYIGAVRILLIVLLGCPYIGNERWCAVVIGWVSLSSDIRIFVSGAVGRTPAL